MNPHNQRQRTTQQTPEALAGLEPMHVTRAKGHTSGDTVGHHIEVTPDLYQSTHVTAEVLVTQRGDTYIPEEGERVFATRRTNGQPVVVGSRYGQEDDIPEFKPGERRIGHPPSDSHIRLKPDGTVRVAGDGPVHERTTR